MPTKLTMENIARYSRKAQRRIRARLAIGKKIFNLSLHRSGTQSAAAFCNELGFLAQHWPGGEFEKKCEPFVQTFDTASVWNLYRSLVQTHNSFHDVPVPFLYREIVDDYPDALYMLILRRPSSWIRSARKHTEGRELIPLEKLQYWTICESRHRHLAHYSDDELEHAYSKFTSDVTETMAARRANFRIFELESADLAPSIAKFCGITRWIPPFEHVDVVALEEQRKQNLSMPAKTTDAEKA